MRSTEGRDTSKFWSELHSFPLSKHSLEQLDVDNITYGGGIRGMAYYPGIFAAHFNHSPNVKAMR